MGTPPAPLAQTESARPRPTSITIVCILGLLGALISIPLIFTDVARSIGAWYPPYLAFSAVVGAVCMIGFWIMRKWSVFAYTAFCALNQIVLLAEGHWNVLALVIPGIVIGIGFANLSKMK